MNSCLSHHLVAYFIVHTVLKNTVQNFNATLSGAYVYFEASWINPYFKPVKGTKAKLVSQAVLLPTVCVSFHYHMYGMNMGSLKLYKMTDKGSLELLWNKEGQQGNEWFREELTINSAKKYQVNECFCMIHVAFKTKQHKIEQVNVLVKNNL